MFPTKNDLAEATRAKVIEILNGHAADCLDLRTQAKHAHWNVKGPNFIALHELFDDVAEAADEYLDLIAERLVQLGGVAEGTLRAAAAHSSLPGYPLDIADGEEHVEALSTALAAFGQPVRRAIDEVSKLGDQDTADLLTAVSRGVDKWLWFVEAHAQGNAARATLAAETAQARAA